MAVGRGGPGHYDANGDLVAYPPVTVFDLATPESRHTIDVHGDVL